MAEKITVESIVDDLTESLRPEGFTKVDKNRDEVVRYQHEGKGLELKVGVKKIKSGRDRRSGVEVIFDYNLPPGYQGDRDIGVRMMVDNSWSQMITADSTRNFDTTRLRNPPVLRGSVRLSYPTQITFPNGNVQEKDLVGALGYVIKTVTRGVENKYRLITSDSAFSR